MARGEAAVKRLFGGTLQQQGRGFYVALELFAILRGSLLLEQEDPSDHVLPPPPGDATFLRPSHDFARRLMADGFKGDEIARRREHVSDETASALKALLMGIQAPVPGRRTDPPDWRKWHLYPYPADFIHYDALHRGRRISIERDSFRGGGGLAHRLLREDASRERLSRIREGLRVLLAPSSGALGSLARALHELDEANDTTPFIDEVEHRSTVYPSPWVELLRNGVLNVLSSQASNSKKTEALMHWVPFCIMRHQLALAHGCLGSSELAHRLVFDCRPENSQVRERARQDFTHSSSAIREALLVTARTMEQPALVSQPSWTNSPRTFLTTTAFAVGAANAPAGLRWFVIRPPLLEAVVIACCPAPQPFERFCAEVLHKQLGMIVSPRAAMAAGIDDIDQSEFEINSEGLAHTLDELGMLERYSDMTRMVGASP